MKMIVMAGGSGSRLWPLSRTYYPKQFLKLSGMEESIFQMTIKRCLMIGGIEDVYIVTSKSYLHLVSGQIEEMAMTIPGEQILLEPEAKNTLPAIMYAAREIRKKGDDICAVFASDHVIDEPEVLAETILSSRALAEKGFVCFGIKPTGPEPGYGYIKPGEKVSVDKAQADASDKAHVSRGYLVAEFREKPDIETAKKYVKEGYLWNSGIFMFHSAMFFDAVAQHNPEVYEAFLLTDIAEVFDKTPSISVDYGLIEKMETVYCVPLNMDWNDVGNFTTFYDRYHTKKDECGNVYFNDEILLDSENNLVYSEGDKAVALIGVSDVVIVDQKDALLVCRREDSQKVKEVVDTLKNRTDERADYHLTVYKPWGSYTILEDDKFYKVKRLTVLPEKRLSYQMHYHRNEHWIVVSGTATVVIDDKDNMVRSGESIYIRSGERHRLINSGNLLLEVIEVQNGEYLGEDDIVRYQDDYVR